MNETNIFYDIIVVLESKDTDGSFAKHMKHYTGYHQERPDGYGGVGILIRNDAGLKHKLLFKSSGKVEAVAIEVTGDDGKALVIVAIYIPKPERIELEDVTEAISIDGNKALVVGDINMHHETWDLQCNFCEKEAGEFIDFLNQEMLTIENDARIPTRIGRGDEKKQSSPDVTTSRGVKVSNWKVEHDGFSDHGKITYSVDLKPVPGDKPVKARWALHKAKWPEYQKYIEENCVFVNSVKGMEDLIMIAAKKFIPKGFARERSLWTEEMERVEKAFQEAHTKHLKGEVRWEERQEAKKEMTKIFNEERTKHYAKRLAEADVNETWKIIGAMGKSKKETDFVLQDRKKRELKTEIQQAKAFLNEYAEVSTMDALSVKPSRVRIHKTAVFHPVTNCEYDTALRHMSNGRAVGTDDIPIEMIKNFGEKGRLKMILLITEVLRTGEIPNNWKLGEIIPLLKPAKAKHLTESYRPVTLTSHISKLAERIIAARILFQIHDKLDPAQYGFLRGKSTIDAIHEVIDYIVDSGNEHQKVSVKGEGKYNHTDYIFHRAVAVLIDFTSAFDTVDHDMVINQLKKLNVGDYETRFIRNFLCERKSRVRHGRTTTDWKEFTAGVPQGTVLGPLLFIIAMDDLLKQLRPVKGLKSTAFADDLTLLAKALRAEDTKHTLQPALNIIKSWCENVSKMRVSVSKTVEMVFTQGNGTTDRDKPPELYYGNQKLKVETPQRLLGVMLDRRITFKAQAERVQVKNSQSIRALSCISNKSTGLTARSAEKFIKGIGISRLTYCAEIWWHLASEPVRETIRVAHRKLLKLQHGLPQATSTRKLYQEADTLPLDHLVQTRTALWVERLRSSSDPSQSATGNKASATPTTTRPRKTLLQSPQQTAVNLSNEALRYFGIPLEVQRGKTILYPMDPRETKFMENITFGVDLPPKDTLSKEEQRAASLEAIGDIENCLALWPDGSAFVDPKKKTKSGAGGVITMNGKILSWYSEPVSVFACSTTAEELALLYGLKKIVERGYVGIIKIFIDNKSVIRETSSGPILATEDTLRDIFVLLKQLIERGCKIHFQHIFSHCGLQFNEHADVLADKGASRPYLPLRIAPKDMRYIIKQHARNVRCFEEKQQKEIKKQIKKENEALKTREKQVIAAQIRTKTIPDFGEFRTKIRKTCGACRFCDLEPNKADQRAKQKRIKSREAIECDICKNMYSDLYKLKRHCRDVHKEEWTKPPLPPPSTVPVTTEETLEHLFICEKATKEVKVDPPKTMEEKVNFILLLRELAKKREEHEHNNVTESEEIRPDRTANGETSGRISGSNGGSQGPRLAE